jgi:uncharacterized protein YneR
MNILISNQAAEWYIKELELKAGDSVRFFARYGGQSPVQKGFSLGISKERPELPGAFVETNHITFFIEQSDIWYFDDHDFKVAFNDKHNEPEFIFEK